MSEIIYSAKRKNENDAGFTLMELMIVVAIVGVLTAIAFPSYTQYVERGKRAEGRAALSEAAGRLERYYSDNNSYATADNAFPAAANITTTSATNHYIVSIETTGTHQTYTLVATPQTFTDTKCGNLRLLSTGARSTSVTPTDSDCWSK